MCVLMANQPLITTLCQLATAELHYQPPVAAQMKIISAYNLFSFWQLAVVVFLSVVIPFYIISSIQMNQFIVVLF